MERIHAKQSSPLLCVRLILTWKILYIIRLLNLPDSGLLLHSLFSRKQTAALLLLGITPFSIAGADLLSMALQRVLDVEYLIGGKTVYIECNNQPKLFDFYSASGFLAFDKRNKQGSADENDVLVQMLKYFNH